MDLHWRVCPYCGNNHFDPYQVGPPVVLAEEVVAARETLGPDEPYEEGIQDRLEAVKLESETEAPDVNRSETNE
jgi:hypothetical protein